MRVLVRAPSADVSSNLDFEVHAPDSSGCRCIWLFYNQDAYNQDVYVADVGVQSTRNNNNKNSWHGEARARARRSVKHPTKVTSFHAHSSPDNVGMTFIPVLQREETEAQNR